MVLFMTSYLNIVYIYIYAVWYNKETFELKRTVTLPTICKSGKNIVIDLFVDYLIHIIDFEGYNVQ